MKTPAAVALAAVAAAAALAVLRHPPAPPAPAAGVALNAAAPVERASAAAGKVVVYVAGEVRKPGVYTLAAGSRAQAAVAAAGGFTAAADPVAVNLAEPLADGAQVVVAARGEAPAPRTGRRRRAKGAGAGRGSHRRSHGKAHKAPPAAPVDLNAADAGALESLPGVGPSLAERIVAFRDLNGPFRSADELLDVAGMSERRLDEISPYLVVK